MDDTRLIELAGIASGDVYSAEANPLDRDDMALRLAVRLRLCYGPNLDGDKAVVFGNDGGNFTEPYGDDPERATRRAIVRAAAAMAGEKT